MRRCRSERGCSCALFSGPQSASPSYGRKIEGLSPVDPSYFEGLADYVRATGDKRVREAVLRYFALVRDRELTLVGNGGADQPFHPHVCGEAWSNTAREQTNPDITRMMETCTGVTWMKFCSHVLRLTGDCSAADGTIPARRIQPAPSGARLAFEVPVRGGAILMTDYASADGWNGSRIRTWIAKPDGAE